MMEITGLEGLDLAIMHSDSMTQLIEQFAEEVGDVSMETFWDMFKSYCYEMAIDFDPDDLLPSDWHYLNEIGIERV